MLETCLPPLILGRLSPTKETGLLAFITKISPTLITLITAISLSPETTNPSFSSLIKADHV